MLRYDDIPTPIAEIRAREKSFDEARRVKQTMEFENQGLTDEEKKWFYELFDAEEPVYVNQNIF